MAILAEAINIAVPKTQDNNLYYGISRKYFPKWEGWEILDKYGYVPSNIVKEFYNIYFWARFRGDEIRDKHLASLLLAFSIYAGKKKAISKLQLVIGAEITGFISDSDISLLNRLDKDFLFLHLYTEIVEFMYTMSSVLDLKYVVSVYYDWVNRD